MSVFRSYHKDAVVTLLLLAVLLLFGRTAMLAQSQPNTLSVELAYSMLSDEVGFELDHREHNYVLGIGYHISQRWALAAQGTLIRSNFEQTPGELSSAFLAGLTGEYDLMPESKHRFFLELGLATGNYCTCGDRLPRTEAGLFYARYGMGADISIYRDIQIALGFEANSILGRTSDRYNYNIFTIGLTSNRWLQLGGSSK